MNLMKVGGITVLNYPYRAHASTFFHSFSQTAAKPVRSSKLGISHQCNTLCANMRKETHIALSVFINHTS